MSLIDALERVEAHNPQPFIAPLLDAGRVDVFTVQDNIPYEFRVRGADPGWFRLHPAGDKQAKIGNKAQAWERLVYLESLPRFYCIAVYPLSESTWLVVPYNAADAAQRGWPNAEPRQVHLVVDSGLQPFTTIGARMLDNTLLYERNAILDLDQQIKMHHCLIQNHDAKDIGGEWQLVWAIFRDRQRELERQRVLLAKEKARATVEGEIRWQLDFMGANLLDWQEGTEAHKVTWEYNGASYTMDVKRDMRIASAGICLDGRDAEHNLSSVVAVMERARRLHRYDLNEEYYIND